MARRVTIAAIVVGQPPPFPLSIAQGEDREFRLTFLIPPDDPAYDPTTPKPVNFTGLTTCDLAIKDPHGLTIIQRAGTVVGSPTNGTLSFVFGFSDTINQSVQTDKLDAWWRDSTFEQQLQSATPFEILESVTDLAGPSSQPPPLPVFSGPFQLAVAVFDGSSAQATATWADLGSPPAAFYGLTVVTDSGESVMAQIVKSSITSSSCVVQINDDIECTVYFLVRP